MDSGGAEEGLWTTGASRWTGSTSTGVPALRNSALHHVASHTPPLLRTPPPRDPRLRSEGGGPLVKEAERRCLIGRCRQCERQRLPGRSWAVSAARDRIPYFARTPSRGRQHPKVRGERLRGRAGDSWPAPPPEIPGSWDTWGTSEGSYNALWCEKNSEGGMGAGEMTGGDFAHRNVATLTPRPGACPHPPSLHLRSFAPFRTTGNQHTLVSA